MSQQLSNYELMNQKGNFWDCFNNDVNLKNKKVYFTFLFEFSFDGDWASFISTLFFPLRGMRVISIDFEGDQFSNSIGL